MYTLVVNEIKDVEDFEAELAPAGVVALPLNVKSRMVLKNDGNEYIGSTDFSRFGQVCIWVA